MCRPRERCTLSPYTAGARRNSLAPGPSTKEEAMSTDQQDASGQPTVVLLHGAWADGSSWNDVIERLQAQGVQVTAPANPLRGISIDSAYIGSLLDQIPGPVLVVAHSYGGGGITNAAPHPNNILRVVYVSPFAPDEGGP